MGQVTCRGVRYVQVAVGTLLKSSGAPVILVGRDGQTSRAAGPTREPTKCTKRRQRSGEAGLRLLTGSIRDRHHQKPSQDTHWLDYLRRLRVSSERAGMARAGKKRPLCRGPLRALAACDEQDHDAIRWRGERVMETGGKGGAQPRPGQNRARADWTDDR